MIQTRNAKTVVAQVIESPITFYGDYYSDLKDNSGGTSFYQHMPPPDNFGQPGDVYQYEGGNWISTGSKWWLVGTNLLYP